MKLNFRRETIKEVEVVDVAEKVVDDFQEHAYGLNFTTDRIVKYVLTDRYFDQGDYKFEFEEVSESDEIENLIKSKRTISLRNWETELFGEKFGLFTTFKEAKKNILNELQGKLDDEIEFYNDKISLLKQQKTWWWKIK